MKLCVMCKHFGYDRIYSWESECSGGTEGGYACAKGHYLDSQPSDVQDFRALIARAAKCKDYDDSEDK